LEFPKELNSEGMDEFDAQQSLEEGFENEAELCEPEPEIDPVADPMDIPDPTFPNKEWERMIKGIKTREPKIPSEEEQRRRMRWILSVLDNEKGEPTVEQVLEATTWLEGIQSIIPNHDEFVASSFAHHYPAWHELLKGVNRKSAKTVLGWLRKGFKPRFAGTSRAKESKRKIVVGMLRKVVPKGQISTMLSGKFPHRVEFENHRSFYTNWPFSSDQIQKLVQYGAAGIWDFEEPPVIIHPMGVVLSAGKERMIVNGRYLNLLLEALPFRYERLRDILAFTKEGFFMATWDLKSGYFHVPIHLDYYKYFCFKVGKTIFYFKVLCFGLSQACFVFTKVMLEPALELRKRGVPISDYIDDSFTAARTRNRCLRQSVLSILFFGALGAFMGLPKCNLWPEVLIPWLGFQVDPEEQQFKVEEVNLEKLKLALREVLSRPTSSARQIAAIAGKIVAISPAVLPAAMFSRSLFDAMKGRASWDEIFPTPEAVKKTARFWLQNLDRFNGRRWWPHPINVEVSADASGIGYGGRIRLAANAEIPFTGTFTETQGASSSTARKIRGYGAALKIITEHLGTDLRDSAILLYGDNQGAISTLNKLRSPVPEIQEILQEVFRLCFEFKFDLVARWKPRDQLEEEDALLRQPDSSDWAISPIIYQEILEHFGVRPEVDLFASDRCHVVDRFVSQYRTPGCLAVDATRSDWKELVHSGEIAWLFPPNRCVSLALSMLESFRIEALVCMPVRPGSNELIQLERMAGAISSHPFIIPRNEVCCSASDRVPQEVLNPVFLGLGVLHIQWI
jgi:hypothetical protein